MRTQVEKLDALSSVKSAISRPILVHHVARRLGLSRRMVRNLAETARLPGVKVGRRIWQFLPRDVEEFRARREDLNV